MKLIYVCVPLHDHIQTQLKHKPILSAAKPQVYPSVSTQENPPQLWLLMQHHLQIRMGINLEVAQSLTVTFASAFKQKIMNNQAETSLDAIAAF